MKAAAQRVKYDPRHLSSTGPAAQAEREEAMTTTTRHIAYVPVVSPLTESFGIGVADADSAGYVPIEDGYGTYEEARKAADQRNRECGISEKEATAVAICSMFRPGEYDDVLGTL